MIKLNQHKETITKLTIARFSDDVAPKLGLGAFFPARTSIEEELAIEVQRNRQLVAVDVVRCTDARLNTFSKYSEKLFKPPYFNEGFVFSSCKRYGVTFGRRTNPTVNDAASMVDEASSNLIALRNKISRAIELMRASVLQTGTVTLVNGDSIDFKRKAGSMPVLNGTNVWTNAASKPLADLKAGATFLRQEGLSTGSRVNVIMGENAFSNFMANSTVTEQAQWKNITRLELGMPQFDEVTGFVYQGVVAAGDYQFVIWTYNSWYEQDNGTKVQYIDTNNVIMLPNDFDGVTGYAGLPAVFDVDGKDIVMPVEAEFFVHDYVDQKKKAWMFEVSSAPLPIPVSIDRMYTIKTA